MSKFFEKDWIYDLETYPNFFSCTAKCAATGAVKVFEISDRKDDTEFFLDWLREVKRTGVRMVGFNNISFDYPVIHWMLGKAIDANKKGKSVKFKTKDIYAHVQKIINSFNDTGFGASIRDADVIIPQLDLYRVKHFESVAIRTSLKLLEFNMRSNNIEDLPYPVGTVLDDQQKDVVLSYNLKDVEETEKFYGFCYDAIAFRTELTQKYGFDCTNLNDSKIGEKFFMQRIEAENPYAFYEPTIDGRRRMRQTKRESIAIKDCIFKYICFAKPEFRAVKEWLERQVITETSGVFSDLEEHVLGVELAKYAEMVVKNGTFKNPLKLNGKGVAQNDFDPDNPEHVKVLDELKAEFLKAHPLGWFTETRLNKTTNRIKVNTSYRVATNLNVMIDGFRYDFGVGGIHGSLQGAVHAKKGWRIIDLDVR